VNDSIVTLQGWVGGGVSLRRAGDALVATFRLGCTPRHFRRDTQTWADDQTQWFTVSAWRTLGEHCEASLQRGDAVVVQGRLRLSTWVDGNGAEQQTWEVVASSVGHDLNRGTSRFQKASRAEPAAEATPVASPAEADGTEVAA
jgi:single-strand DNA-binding protein